MNQGTWKQDRGMPILNHHTSVNSSIQLLIKDNPSVESETFYNIPI